MAIVPAFADLDGDGKPELIVGSKNGQLALFQHNDDGNYQLCDVRYLNIDVGEYSAPQFFDLDEDGITDLVIGAKNGKMSWYKGSLEGQKLTFSLVTDFLGEVNVTDYNLSYDGFCVPHFFHDTFGHIRLICGSEQGKLFLFDQIEGILKELSAKPMIGKQFLGSPMRLPASECVARPSPIVCQEKKAFN